jgi:hypothetical protein
MKIRVGFVSNSSSSSFAINLKEISAPDLHNIVCKYLEKSGEYYPDLKFMKNYLFFVSLFIFLFVYHSYSWRNLALP